MEESFANQAADPTQFNIEAISRLEHEALDRRTATERASDLIVKLVGSIQFLLLQVVLVAAWATVNLNLVPGLKPFDPFPFGSLALVVSSESVCLTIFVLIKSESNGSSDRKTVSPGPSGEHARGAGTYHRSPNAAKALQAYGRRCEISHSGSSRI
jgi:uncharacterized membrane protein